MKVPYIPYNKKLIHPARNLRRKQTLAEEKLWQEVLRYRRVNNYKFNRQKIIINYIVDFYCSELMLVIEVDGHVHDLQKTQDRDRTLELTKYGLKIIRFVNAQVIDDIETVRQEIIKAVKIRARELGRS